MPFNAHYVGLADGAVGTVIEPSLFQSTVKIGSVLWTISDTYAVTQLNLYKSTDSGATSTLMTSINYSSFTPPGFLGFSGRVVVYHEGLIKCIAAYNDGSDSTTFTFVITTIDPSAGSPTFSSWATLPFVGTALNINDGICLSAEVRLDGSLLLGYSDVSGTDDSIHFRSLSSGTWTDIGGIATTAGQSSYLASWLIAASGLIYTVYMDGPTAPTVGFPFSLVVRTLTTGNVIGSSQAIASNINTRLSINFYRGTVLADGTLCIGYVDATPSPNSNSMVAFGDTASPLSPTWTLTTLANSGQNTGSRLVVQGSTLWAYFNSGNTFGQTGDALYRSSWSGTAWNTPGLWLDPTAQTPSNPQVINFEIPFALPTGAGLIAYMAFDTPALAFDGPALAGGSYMRMLPPKGKSHSFMLA